MIRRWLAAGLVAAFAAATAGAAAPVPVPVSFPGRDVGVATGTPAEMLTGLLFLPDVPPGTPVPAVVALHGCGGMYSAVPERRDRLSVRHRRMAELLVGEGYAVLFPDSFRPRGREEVCTVPERERTITPSTRRQDALAALAYLQARGDVRADRIAVLGWSHGGSTVLATLNARLPLPPEAAAAPPFRAGVAYYPGCRASLATRGGYALRAPLLVLVGGRDDWTSPRPCTSLAARLRDAGEPATLALYADAFHGFDGPDGDRRRLDVPGGVRPGQGVTVASDPAARADAYLRTRAFLRAELVGEPARATGEE